MSKKGVVKALLVLAVFGVVLVFQSRKDTRDIVVEQEQIADTMSVEPNTLMTHVAEQVSFGPRYVGGEGYEAFHLWAKKHFSALQGTFVTAKAVPLEESETVYTNLIWRFNPDLKERVLLGTHYDTKGKADQEEENKEAYVPGANDGASGVAVLLEVARALSAATETPSVGVDVVLFDGEEGDPTRLSYGDDWYPIGSTYFAEHLEEFYPLEEPEAVIIVDMVCDADLVIQPERFSVERAPYLTKTFFEHANGLYPKIFKTEERGGMFDDHTPFQKKGIATTLLIDFTYPYWHTTQDTPDKCSGDNLRAVTHTLLSYLYTL